MNRRNFSGLGALGAAAIAAPAVAVATANSEPRHLSISNCTVNGPIKVHGTRGISISGNIIKITGADPAIEVRSDDFAR